MPTWLASIFGSIFKVGLGFLKDLYKEEKAKEYEWAAKTNEARLESVKDAEKMTLKIKATKPIEIAATPGAWNSGVGLESSSLTLAAVLLVCILFLPGCMFTRFVYKEAKLPIIEAPGRPALATTPPFSEREKKLIGYAQQLETKIGAYNKAAKEHNAKNGF